MKCQSVFIILLAFFLNVAISSIIPEENTTTTEVLSPYYDSSKSIACLDEFTPIIQSTLGEIKNMSLSCVASAGSEIQAEMEVMNQNQAEIFKKLNGTQSAFNSCTQKAGPLEYLECLRSFTVDSRKVLDEMDVSTVQSTNQISKIKNDKDNCENTSITANERKSTNAYFNLRKCLLGDSQNTTGNASQTYYAERIMDIYRNLESCLVSPPYPRNCKTKSFKEMDELNIKEVLIENSAEYFSKLHEIQKENQCVRHFVTAYIFPEFGFDWQSCIISGYVSISIEDYDFDMEFNKLKMGLRSCKRRHNVYSSSTLVKCIKTVLARDLESLFESRINSILEEDFIAFNQNNGVFPFDDACMGFFWKKLQFKGLSIDARDENRFEECLHAL